MFARLPWCYLAVSAAVLATVGGCRELSDKIEDLKKAGSVKEAVSNLTEKAKAPLSLAGSMELSLGQPVKIDRCYVSLVTIAPGRPAVFQISGCKSPGDETFPAAFFRGESPVQTMAELAGQKIRGTLYVQANQDGDVWQSAPENPVEVAIDTVDGKGVTGRVVAGQMIESGSNRAQDVTGKFTGTMP